MKIFGAPNSTASSSVIAQAFDYAGDVVNASLGGLGTSQTVTNAIVAHPNTLYVVSAGNDAADAAQYMPCSSPAPNLVCVGASDSAGSTACASTQPARASLTAQAGTRSFALTRRQNGKRLPVGRYALTLSTSGSSRSATFTVR